MKKICIVIIFLFTCVNFMYADTLSDYQSELEKIKQEQERTASNLTGIEKEIAEDMINLIELDAEVAEYTGKLNELNQELDAVTSEVEEKEKILQNAAQVENAAEELYKTRLKVIYENGIPNVLEILFTSNGISDFFSKINVINSILEYDKKMVENMTNQKEYIAQVSKTLEIQQSQLETLQYDVEKSTEALQLAVDNKQTKIDELENQKDSLNEKATLLVSLEEEAKNKVEEEMARLAAEATQYAGVFTGDYTWPVPGNYRITAAFDEKVYRNIVGFSHTGVDIGLSVGNSVVAANAGKVVIAKYNTGGYGFYIVIDHGEKDGQKYMSLYGHNSNLLVSVGDVVAKGQQIALSGNTGNSTGPHLHYEINRTQSGRMYSMDPMQFYAGSSAPFIYYSSDGVIDYPFSNISKYQYSSQLARRYSF